MSTTPPRPPKGLDSAGRALWRRILVDFDLDPDKLVILEMACKTVDIVARLDTELVGAALIVAGSQGQQREHPALSEVRLQRGLLANLIGKLDVPAGEAVEKERVKSRSERNRANALAGHHGPLKAVK